MSHLVRDKSILVLVGFVAFRNRGEDPRVARRFASRRCDFCLFDLVYVVGSCFARVRVACLEFDLHFARRCFEECDVRVELRMGEGGVEFLAGFAAVVVGLEYFGGYFGLSFPCSVSCLEYLRRSRRLVVCGVDCRSGLLAEFHCHLATLARMWRLVELVAPVSLKLYRCWVCGF